MTNWLDEHGISYAPCAHFARENVWTAYDGSLYVDVPFDKKHPSYQILEQFLELPDGSMRHAGVIFCYLPLSEAMKNSHHDEPGFWEK